MWSLVYELNDVASYFAMKFTTYCVNRIQSEPDVLQQSAHTNPFYKIRELGNSLPCFLGSVINCFHALGNLKKTLKFGLLKVVSY